MVFRKKPDVITRREGNKTLVFHQEIRRLFILNPTSTFIWESCTGERAHEEIGQLLAEHFELPEEYADPSRLASVVADHLELLHQARLLEAAV
ncbi:MAG TPA: PqqD family protein [Thermoanaerobaculia bacterium]|nr:PqqD family protein [Thermoanaerobaculia bacterium]